MITLKRLAFTVGLLSSVTAGATEKIPILVGFDVLPCTLENGARICFGLPQTQVVTVSLSKTQDNLMWTYWAGNWTRSLTVGAKSVQGEVSIMKTVDKHCSGANCAHYSVAGRIWENGKQDLAATRVSLKKLNQIPSVQVESASIIEGSSEYLPVLQFESAP